MTKVLTNTDLKLGRDVMHRSYISMGLGKGGRYQLPNLDEFGSANIYLTLIPKTYFDCIRLLREQGDVQWAYTTHLTEIIYVRIDWTKKFLEISINSSDLAKVLGLELLP